MRGIKSQLNFSFFSIMLIISIFNLSDVLAAHRGRVVASVSIHTYSQLWMSPYGYQSALPADYAEMVLIALNSHIRY